MRDSVHEQKVWEKAAKGASFQVQMKLPDCVIMDSGYCSMGRMIAMKACEQSGYTYYDAEGLLDLLEIREEEKAAVLAYDDILETYPGTAADLAEDPEFIHISGIYNEAIKLALAKGKCLIHERASIKLVQNLGYSCLALITYSNDQTSKRERALTSPGFAQAVADGMDVDVLIERQDVKRRLYHDALDPDHPWGVMTSYDFCLNTDYVGRQKAIELIAFLLKE